MNVNRREFVVLATAACACTVCPDTADAAPAAKIDVGTPGDYPSNVVSDKFKKTGKILVVRSGDQLYAMSSVCTHKGCAVNVKDGQIKCPCHGTVFSDRGTVTDGPARISLVRYAIALNDKKRIIVDKGKQFSEKQWENAGSFLKLG
jgi:cytochrome b6-f complex iron-sulfur subunit